MNTPRQTPIAAAISQLKTADTAKPKRKYDTVIKLSTGKLLKLGPLVQAEYTSSGKTDEEFATYASEKFGFQVTHYNIAGMRREYDIPSLRDALRAKVPVTVMARIEALEAAVRVLKEQLDVWRSMPR